MPTSEQPYNLFIGTTFSPLKGDCSLILTHIREVWCSGNEIAYHYVIGWLARMVQKPGTQGQTVIVLRSGEGTGKNIIIDILDRYFGAHSVMLTKPEDLAGFNDHLGLSVFVFLNEALWGGNKSVEGTMKSTITDDVLLVERKYLPKFKARNCTHIMVATNNDWAVPVGIDDRRFLILDASESRKGDFGYFKNLAAHIKSGGQEAFIQHLLHEVDISSFDVRAIPELNSATKLDHKVRTMDSITRWWMDVLTDGGFSVKTQGYDIFAEWMEDKPLSISSDDFYQSYLDATRSHHKEAKHSVTKKVGELLGKPLEQTRPRQPESGRTRKHVLPPLRDARIAFEAKLRQSGPWHNAQEVEESAF
jgi:phage/plasmid-associated DNA primase